MSGRAPVNSSGRETIDETREGGESMGGVNTGSGGGGNGSTRATNQTETNQMDPLTLTLITPSPTDLKLAMDYNKLKGQSNYIIWSDNTQSALEYLGFWDYVTGDIPKPPINQLLSRDAWIKNDEKALFLVKNRIEDNLQARIRQCKTSSNLWEKIDNMYRLKGVSGKQAAWEAWERVQLKENGEVAQYLADHENARSTIEELGTQIDDEYAALRLLIGLPPSWNVFRSTIETGAADRDENLDYDKIYRLISQEDNRRKADKTRQVRRPSTMDTDHEIALVAKERPKSQLHCDHCGRDGHEREKCWKIIGYPNDRRRKPKKDEDEHKDQTGDAKQATVPFDFAGSFVARSNSTQSSHPRPKRSSSSTSSRQSLFMADMDVVLVVQEAEMTSCVVKGEENYAPFLLDSGSSFHMCGNRTWFTTLEDYDGPIISAAGHEKHKVNQRGSICFKSIINGKQTAFSLTDVNYIPGFSNLLSLGALKAKKVRIELNSEGFTLTSSEGVVFAKGSDQPKNLFRLDAEVVIGKAAKVDELKISDSKARYIRLWHRRLCHASVGYMQILAEKRSIIGATKDEISQTFRDNPCVTCTKGKGHRAPFMDSDSHATVPLELIHSDVKGPVPIPTMGGCRYRITFMDDSTRFLWTYPMRSKRDVISISRDWMNLVENQLNLKVRRFRTDNGTEYSRLEPYLSDKGIKRETTIPHTPQQNGRAERINRTLADKIACMMIDAGLAPSYWAEALLQATYVINRSPSKPLDMVTPYESLHGIVPDLSDLHVWGSPCQALILPKTSGFGQKTTDCLFLGYSEMKKGYRLLDIKGRKIIHSREVTFFEAPDKEKDLEVRQEDINNENSAPTSPEEDAPPVEGNGSPIDDEIFYDAEGGDGPGEHEDELPNEEDEFGDEQAEEQAQEQRPEVPRDVPGRPVRDRRPPGFYWIADPAERARQEELQRRANRVDLEENDSYSYLLCNAITESQVPQTYEEAVQDQANGKWKAAMDSELKSMEEMNVWELVPLPEGRKLVGCKWVYALKLDADGKVIKYKARIVAQGFTQRAGIDFHETYAPVARMNSTRAFLAYVTKEAMFVIQADVKTAYLNGDMKEEVYMRAPPGLNNPKGFVCRILKLLYGLKQSAHAWNNKIDKCLRDMEFKPSGVEPCVYFRKRDGAMVLLYVDDPGMAARDQAGVNKIFDDLARRFKMEKLGDMTDTQWLGVRVQRDRIGRTVALTQERYINESLRMFGLEGASPAKSPLPADLDDSPLASDEAITDKPYLKAIGALMYLSTSTRIDISFSVGLLARFCAKPGDRHWELVMRVFRYLAFTKHVGILMEKFDGPPIQAYLDADWAGDHDTQKSTSGCLIKVFGAPVVYSSKRQRSISRSTLEAEYIAASSSAANVQWIVHFLEELDVEVEKPIKFYLDNTAAISCIVNGSVTDKTKHINISYKIAKELYSNGTIMVEYLETERMEADLLTKALSRQQTKMLMDMIGLVDIGKNGKRWKDGFGKAE